MDRAHELLFANNPGLEAALGENYREEAGRKEQRFMVQLKKIMAEDPGLMDELMTGMRF